MQCVAYVARTKGLRDLMYRTPSAHAIRYVAEMQKPIHKLLMKLSATAYPDCMRAGQAIAIVSADGWRTVATSYLLYKGNVAGKWQNISNGWALHASSSLWSRVRPEMCWHSTAQHKRASVRCVERQL